MIKTNSFDEHITEYDTWFEKHRDLYLAQLEAVRSFIPGSGSGVEIGVGTGRFAAPLGIPIGVEPSSRRSWHDCGESRSWKAWRKTCHLPTAVLISPSW